MGCARIQEERYRFLTMEDGPHQHMRRAKAQRDRPMDHPPGCGERGRRRGLESLGDQRQAAGGIIEGEREMTQDIRTEQTIHEQDIREGRHNAHGHIPHGRLANSDARQQYQGDLDLVPAEHTQRLLRGLSRRTET